MINRNNDEVPAASDFNDQSIVDMTPEYEHVYNTSSFMNNEKISSRNNELLIGEIKEEDGVTKDRILAAPDFDSYSVDEIVEITIPCKAGEIGVDGGYEVISNQISEKSNNAVKVFVKCLKFKQ